MMHTLNDLASQVTVGTVKTEEAQACFLNYGATNLDASIVYYSELAGIISSLTVKLS